MSKSDFLGVAERTWKHIKRLPTSDAFADAVLLQALFTFGETPFGFRRFFPLGAWKWNRFLLLYRIMLMPFISLWHFNLSLRIRGNERKARHTAMILSGWILLAGVISLRIWRWLRRGLRELSEEERNRMSEEEITRYEETRARPQEEREKYALTSHQFVWRLVGFALALNVLLRALQPSTLARFRTPS